MALLGARRGAASALALLALAALALAPAAAQARTTRAYEGSFGSFADRSPVGVAVDQSNGDVYAVDELSFSVEIDRFDSAGAPKDFTAGPDAGTNVLSTDLPSIGFSGDAYIAIDNSGGPLDGTVYVASGIYTTSSQTAAVRAFARSGAKLGEITGSTTSGEQFWNLCGIAVDRSDGSLYVSQSRTPIPGEVGLGPGTTWRYVPDSPFGSLDDADYAVSGATTGSSCAGAADSGRLYSVGPTESSRALFGYSASDFTDNPSLQPTPETLDTTHVTSAAVDPATGQIYSNHGDGVQVYDSSGAPLYSFGARAYFGFESAGIAVKSAASGPAEKAYVADPTTDQEVDVFGALSKAPTYTRPELASFGPDGTDATQFDIGDLRDLAFAGASQRLYALDAGAPGIYGFDAAAPPAFPLLSGFDPLGTAAFSDNPGLAVDNTALASQGNLYLVSDQTDLLYGFDDTGAPLGGAFPLDPATTPGGAVGSPADLCGVAVDSSGNLWVANSATEQLLRYSSAGAYLGAVDTSAQGAPCSLAFDSADNLYADVRLRGVLKYSAASGYTSATHVVGGFRGNGGQDHSLAVDPNDDHLYVASLSGNGWVDEFDPSGNLVDEFAADKVQPSFTGIALDPASGNLFVGASRGARRIHAFGPGVLLPELQAKAASDLANDSATLNGEVNDQGLALSDCHFEYVSEAAYRVSGFTDLASGGSVPCDPPAASIPLDLDEHPVSAPATGLDTNTVYRFRLLASNANGSVSTEALSLASAGPPQVETTGSPIRSATKALLQARVYPVREPTTYHFEYGTQGPCDANPCASSPDRSAGSGDLIRPAGEWVDGLSPNTTYHYRIVADNGNPSGPQAGADMTLTTRASDEPLSHGDYPGPPGSDRAWELVSLSDSGGNPLGFGGEAFSTDGDRAYYGILGGTPIGEFGSLLSLYFAERPAGEHPSSGWQSRLTTPSRSQASGEGWGPAIATDDLATALSQNIITGGRFNVAPLWRLSATGAAAQLHDPLAAGVSFFGFDGQASGADYGLSGDGSRVAALLEGGAPDPAYPGAGTAPNVYDISSGAPALLSLLPGGVPPTCGVDADNGAFNAGSATLRRSHWISADGNLVLFPSRADSCTEEPQLYLRDVAAAQTTLISGPPLSGGACEAALLKQTEGAVFFLTRSRLVSEDSEAQRCRSGGGGDAYRYDEGDKSLRCLTCTAPGLTADVPLVGGPNAVVSEDGSRLYFTSPAHLLPGSPPAGADAIYRLEVASGDLAYIAPGGDGLQFLGAALNHDGSLFFFSSDSGDLDPLGGAMTNGGKAQIYRYSDAEGSITCVSCPRDGSAPVAAASDPVSVQGGGPSGPNTTPLAADGTFAFTTPTALLNADQNTPSSGDLRAGTDAYEWRDGRLLLVTDGISSWPSGPAGTSPPSVLGIGDSGRDLFFRAPAQYTPDAIDNYARLYDARIGGGIDFPEEAQPCPLEVCQGTPQGRPELPATTSDIVSGAGNPAPEPAHCAAPARRAVRLARQARRYALRAKRMRAIAKRSANPRRSRTARRRAHRLAKAAGRRAAAARKLRKSARRCRANNARRASR
jgi:hypothetical protein